MRQEFLPFVRPSITEADIDAVAQVLRSGWITNGPANKDFEQAICEYTGSKHGVALASATGAMHLLMFALNLGPGDEVITPSLTWVSTVNMIVLKGATPVFAEIDRDTLLVTPETVRAQITPRTKMIIPVHYAGVPVDLDGIRAVAGDIPVVEDAAHALGTYYKGRHVVGGGHGFFSFHAIKNLTTAEGGMFMTDDADLANLVRRWKFHGIGVDAFDRENRGRSPQAEVIEPGFKYNLTDMQAARGLSQLPRLKENNAKRRHLAMYYRQQLAGLDEIRPLADPTGYDFESAWHLMIVRICSPAITRNQFMAALKEENIGSGLHFLCAHRQKYYREKMGCEAGMLPETEWNSDRICSLPLFPEMTERDVDDVVLAIRRVLTRAHKGKYL